MARLGQLSNDELAGEEEAVMTVMSLLGELMSVVDVNFNVSRAIGRAPATAFLFKPLRQRAGVRRPPSKSLH